jgi:hypothetical protein
MYYSTSNDINVYKNSNFVMPTNGNMSTGNLILMAPSGNYMPQIDSPAGTNYKDNSMHKVWFSIDGSDYIDLFVSAQITYKFGLPSVTANQFFDSDPDTLYQRIADLLGIPSDKILFVNIVRQTSKKRDASSESQIVVVIGSNPSNSSNNTAARASDIAFIVETAKQLANDYLIGTFQANAEKLYNLTVTSGFLEQTPNSPTATSTLVSLAQIGKLVLTQAPSNCREQSPCSVQPVVAVYDIDVIF